MQNGRREDIDIALLYVTFHRNKIAKSLLHVAILISHRHPTAKRLG